ncbi:unnamed protein product [Darwinula stevensoni]|uniref:DNA replication ATP-dependent helicase/nuclease DNA2 n=1 Tax=Darwinula stevensoni TaxID=69355 RepID=A0A7R8ZZB0_9CRUS|nr:unnamed protein product [Darwinula stevensoni]CAG0883234.1 unnamed protein product [Darwinula stevensoni]
MVKPTVKAKRSDKQKSEPSKGQTRISSFFGRNAQNEENRCLPETPPKPITFEKPQEMSPDLFASVSNTPQEPLQWSPDFAAETPTRANTKNDCDPELVSIKPQPMRLMKRPATKGTGISPNPKKEVSNSKFTMRNVEVSHVRRCLTPKKEDRKMLLKELEAQFIPETTGKSLGDWFPKEEETDNDLLEEFLNMSPFKDVTNNRRDLSSKKASEIEKRLPQKYHRCTVVEVDRSEYPKSVRLLLRPENETQLQVCILRSFWMETPLKEGDTVNVECQDTEEWVIDGTQGLLVLHPDCLMSGTSVVAGVFCRRKAVLNELFKGYDPPNKHMVIGSLLHQVFQKAMKERVSDENMLRRSIEEAVKEPDILSQLYAISYSVSTLMEEAEAYIQPMSKWIQKHCRPNDTLQVLEVQDIEENIWSPRFGVKGKVDLTVEVKIHGKKKVLPLELKTGKASFSAEHKGQVTLYSMMMAERRNDPEGGILLYLKDGSMEMVSGGEKEKQGLMQLRNDLASHLNQKPIVDGEGSHHTLPTLPPVISHPRACPSCPQLLPCSIYQQSVEKFIPAPPHPMSDLVPQAIGHLKPEDFAFATRWFLLCALEDQAERDSSQMHSLWMPHCSKEKEGPGLQNLSLKSSKPSSLLSHIHVFESQMSLETVDQVSVGDGVIVSTQDGMFLAVSMGTITDLLPHSIVINLDKDLLALKELNGKQFRADKQEFLGSTRGICLSNLMRLMENDPVSTNLRQFIIHKYALFCFILMGNSMRSRKGKGLKKEIATKCRDLLRGLNEPQQRAVLHSLLVEDFLLIKGMPGTGKTWTIVTLVNVCVRLGQTVLLTSYTHSAVDNILLKLLGSVEFLRLGRASRVHPQVLPHSEAVLASSLSTLEELERLYMSKPVVATTCLGVRHPLLTRRTFDVCIVDEAAQTLELAALGPLFSARKFVLVGDSDQLPPVVKSHQAR